MEVDTIVDIVIPNGINIETVQRIRSKIEKRVNVMVTDGVPSIAV